MVKLIPATQVGSFTIGINREDTSGDESLPASHEVTFQMIVDERRERLLMSKDLSERGLEDVVASIVTLMTMLSFMETENLLSAWSVKKHGRTDAFKGIVGGVKRRAIITFGSMVMLDEVAIMPDLSCCAIT